MLDEKERSLYVEKIEYRENGEGTDYELFSHKNLGWRAFMRREAFHWGIDSLTSIMKEQRERLLK